VSPSVFAKIALTTSVAHDGARSGRGEAMYVDGVPLWLQEVVQLWTTASEVRRTRGAGSAVSRVVTWRVEQQAAWANRSTHLLRDFVASQKFAKALQRARKALKRSSPRLTHGEAASLPSPPVFAELMRSYDALSRSIGGSGAATASSRLSLEDTAIMPSMWSALLCRFLWALPEPLMPALCSRQLEPLLAKAADPQRAETRRGAALLSSPTAREVAVMKVLQDSFVSTHVVSFTTFCFLLGVVHQHRSELTGEEVEALADAMLRESAVPDVARAVAHACKPEARMFWPTAEKTKSVAGAVGQHGGSTPLNALGRTTTDHRKAVAPVEQQTTSREIQNTVQGSPATAGLEERPGAQPAAAVLPARVSTENGAETAGRGNMAPPASEDETDSTSGSSERRGRRTSDEQEQSEESDEGDAHFGAAESAAHDAADEGVGRKGKTPMHSAESPATADGGTRGEMPVQQKMQWRGSSSSYSSSDSEGEDNDSFDWKAVSRPAGGAAPLLHAPPLTPLTITTAAATSAPTPPAAEGGSGVASSVAVEEYATPYQPAMVAGSPLPPPPSSPDQLLPLRRGPPHSAKAAATVITVGRAAQLPPSSPPDASTTLAEAPSLADVSPVRRIDLSLRSRRECGDTALGRDLDGDATIPSALFSQRDAADEEEGEEDETFLPSALASHPDPTPLRPSGSRNHSALYPSALEEEDDPLEALRRALQPVSSDHHLPLPSTAPASGSSSTSRSPNAEGSGAVAAAAAAAMSLCPLSKLPSLPCPGALRTPRDELELQQQQAEQQQQQQQVQTPQLSSTGPVAAAPQSLPCRAQRTQPLLTALVEAKQRFLAAPVRQSSLLPISAAARQRSVASLSSQETCAPKRISCGGTCGAKGGRDDMLRLRRVWACAQEEGWSVGSLLAALHAYQAVLQEADTSSNTLTGQQRSGERRVLVCSPPPPPAAALLPSTAANVPPVDVRHHSSSASAATVLHLENTREFFKDSGTSTFVAEEKSFQQQGKTHGPRGLRAAATTTGTSLVIPSTDEDSSNCGMGDGSGQREREVRAAPAGRPVHSRYSGSSLTTPEDTLVTTVVADTSAAGGDRRPTSAAFSALEKELQRLREVVRTLETNHYVQTRQATAQTSELAARCAELQRQQNEQAQQFRFTQSRLTDVSHELEDLKDDRARLLMQLTTARQEGAQLRDALFAGKTHV
jgi:hypothetical protein